MILEILSYIVLLAVLAAAGYVGYLFLQGHLNGGGGSSLFGAKPEKRLDVVEQWSLDARRKLVLIRRDSVEHLIMTGGPVDVIIETGIREQGRKVAAPAAATSPQVSTTPVEPAAAAVYSRAARSLAGGNSGPGKTVNGD